MSNVTEVFIVCDWCEDKRPGLQLPDGWTELTITPKDTGRPVRRVHLCNRDHCHAVARLMIEGRRAGLPKKVPE